MLKNSTKKIVKNVIDNKIEALKFLKKKIDTNFEKAVNAIVNCQSKIILCGVGKSGLIAAKIASKAIPDSVYEFAGINPDTGEIIPDPAPPPAAAAAAGPLRLRR